MAAPLRLELFGGFRLTDGRGRPLRIGLRKARGLIAYLALAPGGRASRETLATLLWGGFEGSRARHSLRQCLLHLGRTLGDLAPRADPGDDLVLALPPDAFDVDVTAFADLIERGDAGSLERAAGLLRAPFLDGLYLDSDEFDRWVETICAGLRDRLLAALVENIGRCEDDGAHDRAAEAALAALEIDPLREDLHRRLMRARQRAGRPADALAHYDDLRRTLLRDLGVEPDAQTMALYRSIRGEAAGSGEAPRATIPRLEAFLARLHLFAGRWEAAIERLRGRANEPAAGSLLGLALAFDGQAMASETAFAVLLERFGEAEPAGEILAARGAARLARGEPAAALRDFDGARAAGGRPGGSWRAATLRGLRGEALAALGRRRAAREAFDRALEDPAAAGHPLTKRFRAGREAIPGGAAGQGVSKSSRSSVIVGPRP